jgi:hypothetical protein
MTTAAEVESVEDEFDGKMDFDLGAAVAQEAEANKKPIVVHLNGKKFSIPQVSEWPERAVELLQQGQITACMAMIFPDEPEDPDDDLVQVIGKVPTGAVLKLVQHIMKVSDIDPGKLGRSGNPSLNGQKRSKRT